MWEIWEAVAGLVSGATQGVFEWLPVSSKTILLLIFYWMGSSPESAYLIGLFLNGSTAAAASIYFRRDLWKVFRGFVDPSGEGRRLLLFLTFSTLITAVTAVPLASISAEFLASFGRISMILIAALFAATTVILWLRERIGEQEKSNRSPRIRDALLAGLAQGFSALPGVSRSGITIFALIALGYSPRSALKLSFLMSIPATLGGGIYAYTFYHGTLQAASTLLLVTSIISAIAVSILTIDTLLKLAQKIKPYIFTLILTLLTLAAALL